MIAWTGRTDLAGGYPEDTASQCWILACRIASGFAADRESAATDKERLASDNDDKDERQSWAKEGYVWNAVPPSRLVSRSRSNAQSPSVPESRAVCCLITFSTPPSRSRHSHLHFHISKPYSYKPWLGRLRNRLHLPMGDRAGKGPLLLSESGSWKLAPI